MKWIVFVFGFLFQVKVIELYECFYCIVFQITVVFLRTITSICGDCIGPVIIDRSQKGTLINNKQAESSFETAYSFFVLFVFLVKPEIQLHLFGNDNA